MKALIQNYRNLSGEHCGSAAMRNLLYHYCGLELPEAVVFGLGSGIDAMYIRAAGFTPSDMIFGRSITMELDAAAALGVDYREQPEFDDEKAWADVRQEVLEGRPTMLTGDIFFLDYRNYKVRFPAHRFVLVGFDDREQVAYLADRVDPGPQKCSYRALAVSRNPKDGISTFNLWGKFLDTQVTRSPAQAALQALKITCGRMQGTDRSQAEMLCAVAGAKTEIVTGVDGLLAFADAVKDWGGREQAGPLASYTARSIETFGSGGANFRNLLTSFFEWCRETVPDVMDDNIILLCKRSARSWTELAGVLNRASENDSEPPLWQEASDRVKQIHETETAMFGLLDERTAKCGCPRKAH